MKNQMINVLKNQHQNFTQIINPQILLQFQLKTIPKLNLTQNHPIMTNTVAEKEPGHHQEPSKQWIKALQAITILEDPDNDLDDDGYLNCLYEIPSDIALVGHTSTDTRTLDKVLWGPSAKKWQEALDYK